MHTSITWTAQVCTQRPLLELFEKSRKCILQCALVTHRLIGKADAKSKEDTSNIQHDQVLGSTVDDGTNGEPEAGNDHAPLPANTGIQQVGHETGHSTCNKIPSVQQA